MTPSTTVAATPPSIPFVERASRSQASAKRRNLSTQLKQAAIGMIVGAVGALVGLSIMRWQRHAGHATASAPTKSIFLIIAALVAVTLLVLFIHESGHALLGWMSGMPMIIMWCGPVMITTFRRVRIHVNRAPSLAGGAVLCAPAAWRGRSDFVPRMTRFVAGGPLASFLTGGFAIAVLIAMESPSHGPTSWTRFLLTAFALISVGIGVVTSLPIKMSGMPASDGGKVRWLLSDAMNAEEPMLPYMALALLAQRERPSEWPEHLVSDVQESMGDLPPSAKATTARLLYQRSIDDQDTFAAAQHLNVALDVAREANAGMLWPLLAMDAALYELIVRRDLSAGERWLAHAVAAKHDPIGRALASAASALLRREWTHGYSEIDRAHNLMDEAALPSLALSRRRYLELLTEHACSH